MPRRVDKLIMSIGREAEHATFGGSAPSAEDIAQRTLEELSAYMLEFVHIQIFPDKALTKGVFISFTQWMDGEEP